MSGQETREALAAAATTVEGVKVSAHYRQTTKVGDGWVRLDVVNRDTSGFGFMVAWQVLVVLPQDQATAERWIDKHLDELLEALAPEGVVTTAQPVQLALDTGTLSALIVTVIREKD